MTYSIEFEFHNSFYNSASSYFLNFLGNSTFKSFKKRGRKFAGVFEVKKPEVYELEQEEFLSKKRQFKKEVLLYEAGELLVQRGMLSIEEEEEYRSKLLNDKRFSTQIHCLFEIFNSIEQIENNIDKVHYHIRNNLDSV